MHTACLSVVCFLCCVWCVSDNITSAGIVPGSAEHRELWMIRLREVIVDYHAVCRLCHSHYFYSFEHQFKTCYFSLGFAHSFCANKQKSIFS